MKFIATSDWQLGMTAHYLSDEARPRFHRARLDAIARIGPLATEHGAQFVTVAGDVFETNQLDRAIIQRTFDALQQISVPVLLLPGNHDPLDASSIYDSPVFREYQPEHVAVLRDSEPLQVLPGVQVVGVPWYSKHPTIDQVSQVCEQLSPRPADTRRVLVAHGAVSGLAGSADITKTDLIDLPGLQRAIDSGLIDFVVLGDRHSMLQVAPHIWYPGSPEVTSRREEHPGNVLLVDLGSPSISVTPLSVGQWQFQNVHATLNSLADVQHFGQQLSDWPHKSTAALWLALEGTLTTAEKAELDRVLADARAVFAHVDYWQRNTDLAIIPDDADFGSLGLSGYAQSALDELVVTSRNAENPDAAALAQNALSLLYRLQGDQS